jgi:hypothetical protein
MPTDGSTLPRPSLLGLQPSFGFGDRLGLATPGHLAALRQAGGPIKGIFAQQSIREMSRTQRTASEVMQAAASAIQSANFTDAWGADADHLKTPDDVKYTAAAGFVFFTIDPSDHVDRRADDYDLETIETKFRSLAEQIDWVDAYLSQSVKVPGGPTIEFDRPAVLKAAVKYGAAINHAVAMGKCIQSTASQLKQPCEIEISIDETDQPTSLAEHYIIADQIRRHGLPMVSLAPRFLGDFEKGVDFKGDLRALEKSLADHAAIAKLLGPYKLSLHSGSDKLSMYGIFARATGGLFHVKTAGTSYMEALRVVARCAPEVFREVVEFSRAHYDADKATYHVSATISGVPSPEQMQNLRPSGAGRMRVQGTNELEKAYIECWPDVPAGRGFTAPGRQILHCTFGSVMTDQKLGPLVLQVLRENANVYREVLIEHFIRHLDALQG